MHMSSSLPLGLQHPTLVPSAVSPKGMPSAPHPLSDTLCQATSSADDLPPWGSENPSWAVLLPQYGCLLTLFSLWFLIPCRLPFRDALMWVPTLCSGGLSDVHQPCSIRLQHCSVGHHTSRLLCPCLWTQMSRKRKRERMPYSFYNQQVKLYKYTTRF